ncbi:MAG: hypothetical protein ACREPB_09105 [Arenimonas sp.]
MSSLSKAGTYSAEQIRSRASQNTTLPILRQSSLSALGWLANAYSILFRGLGSVGIVAVLVCDSAYRHRSHGHACNSYLLGATRTQICVSIKEQLWLEAMVLVSSDGLIKVSIVCCTIGIRLLKFDGWKKLEIIR